MKCKFVRLPRTYSIEHERREVVKTVSLSAQEPIVADEKRFSFFQGESSAFKESAALMGTAYVTNKDPKIGPVKILDGFCTGYSLNVSGVVNGVFLAIADGCGGHETEENANDTALTAQWATRYGVEILADYQSPEQCLDQIELLIDAIRTRVFNVHPQAQFFESTLLALRAFQTPEGYRVVGFNVGDSMAIAWDGQQRRFYTLAPAGIVRGEKIEGPANFIHYNPEERYLIDQTLDERVIIIALTDGIHDLLPTETQMRIIGKDTQFCEISLQEKWLNQLALEISPDISAEELMTFFLHQAVAAAECKRQQDNQIAIAAQEQYKIVLQRMNETLTRLSDEARIEYKKSSEYKKLDSEIKDSAAKSFVTVGDDISLVAMRLPDCVPVARVREIVENSHITEERLTDLVNELTFDSLHSIFSKLEKEVSMTGPRYTHQELKEAQRKFYLKFYHKYRWQYWLQRIIPDSTVPLVAINIPQYEHKDPVEFSQENSIFNHQGELRKVWVGTRHTLFMTTEQYYRYQLKQNKPVDPVLIENSKSRSHETIVRNHYLRRAT